VNGSSHIYICDIIARVIRNTLCLHFHAVTDQVIQGVSLLTWVWEMPAAKTSTDTDYTNCSLSWLSQTRQTNAEATPYIEPNSLPSTSLSNLSIPYNFELMTGFFFQELQTERDQHSTGFIEQFNSLEFHYIYVGCVYSHVVYKSVSVSLETRNVYVFA
jgi:hypothetical protein